LYSNCAGRSLKLGGETTENHPGDHVATNINAAESADRAVKRRRVTSFVLDLRPGIAVIAIIWTSAHAREVNWSTTRALVIVALELVDHECVVTILKDRNVFELSQENRNVGGRDEESSK
jgi:hypothetical protein